MTCALLGCTLPVAIIRSIADAVLFCHLEWHSSVQICKMLEKRIWPEQHPLRQFPMLLEDHYIAKLEQFDLTPDRLYDMDAEV
jgi:hypothetical protein